MNRMKLSRHKQFSFQSGSALIGVMVLIVLSMLILPQIMNTSSFAQKRGVAQVVQIRNASKAEEVNHLLHSTLTGTPFPATTHMANFALVFPNSIFRSSACADTNPCIQRLKANDINACPQDGGFVKASWNNGGKTIVNMACRNGASPTSTTNPPEQINCNSGSANLSNTADMRIYTCVYDQGTSGANLAISVWSYMNLTDKFLKVQEDSF